jgi:hypothetical protein
MMSRATRSLAVLVLLCLLVVSLPGRVAASGYRFIIPPVDAKPCQDICLTIQGDHEKSAQGFSLAARYPSEHLEIRRIHLEGTILEAIEADYFEAVVSPEDGTIVVGLLVDSQPPFDGELIPSLGEPLDFLHIEATVLESATEDLKIRFEDGLSVPPINNLYSVGNQSIRVTELGEGVVHVKVRPDPAFVRGDFNMDRLESMADAIGILQYIFRGVGFPRCLDAGDANDDETLDLSDAVYILNGLFVTGKRPPPPSSPGGPDPTPGRLDCQHPLWPLD